jgi:hypothetical protein
MILDKFCFYFHYIIILGVLIGPFLLPSVFIKPYILFTIIIILQWYVFGRCLISSMHKETSRNEGAISTVLNKVNLDVNEHVDAIFYFVILYAFYRINCIKEGIFIVLILILLNKAVFDSYTFKWVNTNEINKE